MSGSSPHAPEEARISAAAALVALGGHAVVLLAALWLSASGPTVEVNPSVVSITVVGSSGSSGGGPAASPRSSPAAAKASEPAAPLRRPAPDDATGEHLDQLLSPQVASSSPAHSLPSPSSASGASASTEASRNSHGSGSSRADRGLGQGEGAEGVDLYAAASLPDVGQRSANPFGDLWRQVSACWRPAAPRPVALSVGLSHDGRLTGAPRAIRRRDVKTDPQTLLAERAAVRALLACAPYPGLGGRQWRVEFP